MYSAGQQYGKILWNSRTKFKPPLTLLQTKFGAPTSVSVLHKGSWQQKNEKQSPSKSAPKEVFVVCNHGLSDIDHVIHTETNMINRYTLCGHCNILGYDASYDQAHWGPEPSDGHRYMSSSDIHSSRQGKKRTSLWYAGVQNHHHMLGSNQYSEMSSHFSSKSLWKYSPFSNTSKTDANWIVIRSFHSSQPLWKEESKAEKTVKALKSEVEKKEAEKKEAIPEKQEPPSFALPEEKKEIAEAPVPKKTISQRIVAELKHYYHGFRLLFIDVRVCSKLLWLVLNGKSLSRRERRQLVRTTADLFRLVPFLVFIIVPFMEFLLPVALKLFPGMLPSTFMEEDREKEKFRKNLKLKLEMAKFLQDTIEETALQRKGAKGDKVTEFVEFLNKIRTTGHGASNEEIMKYCKLFEDEITLDNLNHRQLRALCNLVEIPTMGTSNFLRFQLRLKLRQLEADDRMIQKEGLNSLAVWELQEASRARGMRAVGVPIDRLKLQLQQWLDLHLNHQIPTSLLLLSRTLYLPESVPTEEQLKATISQLPETTAGEAKVKISEVTGDRIDNKIKLEIIKQEQEAIKQEEAERKNEEEKLEKAKVEEKKRKEEEEKAKVEEVPEVIISLLRVLTWMLIVVICTLFFKFTT